VGDELARLRIEMSMQLEPPQFAGLANDGAQLLDIFDSSQVDCP